ncbi:MAG: DUF2194 domain-containing protein, partial [Lachnospiraceae bacterium]|nr:DUF2194 domain-containing protein [Lachnospiraceae bacterium]
MVSRRTLITIILMMMTIFFMFQFTQVVKVRNNQYDTNEYAKEKVLVASERFVANTHCEQIVFLGKETGTAYKTVEEWCNYSKRYLKAYEDPTQLSREIAKEAHLILIDSKTLDIAENSDYLEELAGCNTTRVFLNLPDVKKIKNTPVLQNMLGITEIRKKYMNVEGIQVFEGFLLGGEAAYMPQNDAEKKYNDFAETITWYITGNGTQTYAVAMMKDASVVANDYPRIIWRNNYEGTYIYAVANDFINSETGMGFLSAIDYSANDYVLYPVVNAQNTVISDYPVVAAENDARIKEIYSMDSKNLSRDIFWPEYVSIATRYNLKLTCFLNTGYETDDKNEPSDKLMQFYLQQLKEIDGEMGRSLDIDDFSEFKDKMAYDMAFLEKENNYHYSASYAYKLNDEITNAIQGNDVSLKRIHTVVSTRDKNDELLSYIGNSVTFQGITNVADEYSYRKELKHRCMLTALGYSTTLIDMHKVLFPEESEDEWQYFSKDVAANINTYWAKNREFDYTAVSESDTRVREFLNLKYTYE